jgi:hypothetical protein
MVSQQWYYRKGTARFGPVSSADIKKMATEGKLEPTDLLRGVGMTEWVPASKVKGLFPKTASATPIKTEVKPKNDNELGLAPLEPIKQDIAPTVKPIVKPTAKPTVQPLSKPAAKPATKPVSQSVTIPKPVSTSNSVSNSVRKPLSSPSASPSVTPAGQTPKANPQSPTIPAAPQISTASNVANPFAQFGLEQTTPNDPFAIPNDPFATGISALGNLDNLVALEKQGQTIYREPTVTVEPDPFAATKTKSKTANSSVSDFGPGGYIAFIVMPFLFVLLICFPIGVITAWVPLRIIAIAIAVGTSKMVGLVAGSCMLKVKIKNEVLALGYGGLVGLFATYIFVAASFWTYINVSAYLWKIPQQNIESAELREMDEDGRSLVLRPDEQPQFPDMEQQEEPQETVTVENEKTESGEESKNNESVNVEVGTEENNSVAKTDQEDEESEDEEETEWTQNENSADMKRLQDRMDLMERLFGKGISLFEAILPWILLKFVWIEIEFNPVRYLFYWFLMGGILIAITAHSTWMANLGSDPTSNSAF